MNTIEMSDTVLAYSVVSRAAYVASKAHEGQVRKYTFDAYFTHVARVAIMVADRGGSKNMIAAAYLHDTIEDTDVTEQWLRVYFPPDVVDMVVALTDVYTPKDFPYLCRDQRKELECQRLACESADVQRIKLCDLADNTKSIVEHDPKFAIIYLREKSDILASFRDEVLYVQEKSDE